MTISTVVDSRGRPADRLDAEMEPAAEEVVNCVAYCDGRRIGDVEIEDISEILRFEGQFIWIGLHEPSEALLRQVQEEFGLHDLAIEDAHMAHQRPKVEEYAGSLFVVLRTAQRNGEHIEFGETHIFMGPKYVVSVRHGSTLSYKEVRARCECNPTLLRQGPGFVLYALMDFIVDHYFPIVDDLEGELEKVEEVIFDESASREISQRIYDLKRDLVALKRTVMPLIDVCNRLIRYDQGRLIHDETRPYFRDVYDHVVRINEMTDSMREMLTAALETNLALISVRQSDVMKKLGAWGAILAVPTAIAGIYGMNFDSMPELRWTFGYPLVMATIASLCGFLFFRFRRARWL